jgi:hypothetical protein
MDCNLQLDRTGHDDFFNTSKIYTWLLVPLLIRWSIPLIVNDRKTWRWRDALVLQSFMYWVSETDEETGRRRWDPAVWIYIDVHVIMHWDIYFSYSYSIIQSALDSTGVCRMPFPPPPSPLHSPTAAFRFVPGQSKLMLQYARAAGAFPHR